jgi:hypothetical protein
MVGLRFDDEAIREQVGDGTCVVARDGGCDVVWWRGEGFLLMESR